MKSINRITKLKHLEETNKECYELLQIAFQYPEKVRFQFTYYLYKIIA